MTQYSNAGHTLDSWKGPFMPFDLILDPKHRAATILGSPGNMHLAVYNIFVLHQCGELFRFYDFEKKHFSVVYFSKLSPCPSTQSQVLCKEGSFLQYSFTPLIFHLNKKGQRKQIVGLCGAIESPKFGLVIDILFVFFMQ